MSRSTRCWLVIVLAVVACSADTEPTLSSEARAEGADSAIGAVEGVIAAMTDGDFEAASAYAIPDQAALAALVEGATVADVASGLRQGDSRIASNFWAGFAQGAGSFLTGTVTVVDDGVVDADDHLFHQVRVLPPEGVDRTVLVRDIGGYRIDLFASFGAGLSDKMLAPVERLLGTQTDDAQLVLARLRSIVPSLLVASESSAITQATKQQILSLVELITRVG